jgi:uncharacterized protein
LTESAAPLGAHGRVQALDVLRGVALFGVFLVNLTAFASAPIMATEQQLLSLDTAAWDFALQQLIECLAADKANTIFAFLFGLGFYLQMERLEARGADAGKIYLRRLTVLLVFGVIHMFFLWTWDILHLYALAGFLLLALRELRNRDLLAIGLILALSGRAAQKVATEFGATAIALHESAGYTAADVLLRQQISERGDYFGIVANFYNWVFIDYIASGLVVGWLAYALGRFMIGAWVGRHGWIARAAEFAPGWKRLARWSLPAGLILEGIATLINDSSRLPEWEHRGFIGGILHLAAVPILATGYVSALVCLLNTRAGARLLAPFACSGRMALTNYLTQSLAIGYLLFGVGPGLALAGRIGTCALAGIAIGLYLLQTAFSCWWLGRYAHGPAEWLWRAFTNGERPHMILTRAAKPLVRADN